MNLFNNKTLARHIPHVSLASQDHLKALTDWADLISSGKIKSIKETALSADFKTKIIEAVLGYTSPVGNTDYTVESEQTILKGSVDLALGHFSDGKANIIAPFELKGAKTKDLDAIMPGRSKTPVQQAWEYATNNVGTKWVLVSNYLEIRLYGFGEGTQAYEHFDMARLHEPLEYARFMLLLSADNLLGGKTADLLKDSRREDKDITDALYGDYKALRSTLIEGIRTTSPDIDPLESIATAQTVLDRVLFIAFAEDTGLLPKNILEQAFESEDKFNPRPVWDNFKGLFSAIDKGSNGLGVPKYNGGLFAPDPAIDALTLTNDVCERFKKIGDYDFASEISVTVLGHIFEQSIADVERLQAIARGEEVEDEKAKGTSGRRKRDGVVYTPDYIARFIVEQTIGTHIREMFAAIIQTFAKKGADVTDYENIPWKRKSAELEAWRAYRDGLTKLRIVDPACGSGVFLVMAFDFLKAELNRVNDKVNGLEGKDQPDFFDPDSEILTNNLFGVDVNSESVEIAKLSLWIKTARRGKVLDSLDDNIMVGDSLIEDSNYAYLDHPFTWQTAFPGIFAEGGFDIVLGNPPYVRMEFLKAMKPYLEKRFAVVSDRADLYAYFFERGLKLLKDGGRMGYISSSTFFKTGSGKPLREYLLREATLETIVDFGDLQIFEGVTTYAAILTMKREAPTKEHDLQFWNVANLPTSNFRATYRAKSGPYPQSALGAGSWELESPALRALRTKIHKGKQIFKEVYGSPLYGIKTGLNAAFVIDTATKDRLCAEDPKSAELLKPFLEGKDLKRWRAEARGLWLLLIPKGWTKKHFPAETEEQAWGGFSSAYPAITNWLSPFSEKARKRTDQGDYWWELRACAYYEAFAKPKIMYQDISQSSPFHIDREGRFTANTGYFLSTNDSHLVGFLNSRLFWFAYLSASAQIRGGFVRFFSIHVENMPVPHWETESKTKLDSLTDQAQTHAEARYALQDALRRRVPDLCPPERDPKLTTKLKAWWLLPDFAAFRAEVKKCFKADIPLSERNDWEAWITRDRSEIARLTAEIAKCEAEINKQVYALFDLNDDEIKLLESAI
jgi:type I restriction-modification system DNA methylase subunit